ncbi:hypothetical protein A5719_09530 [Mycolicibacterium peregrinum]|uniref:hypothetical protein n=1 Tax=Mycolicibacterium peregrinum TaxID=43304 RepID=UPI0007EBB61C|nr:hypothetical protein [Mycolicibacterium peregrinum]OBF43317.1 hypothetical protein A5719_09530 [Mycolicibacterium peregrinum]
MAKELEVDTAGLLAAAAASDATAASSISSAQISSPLSRHMSAVGVAAVNAALISVQSRQSTRMTRQADDLSVSSGRYDGTDSDGCDTITTVSV